MPRVSARISVHCGTCQAEMVITPNAASRGHGKYCSMACYNQARTGAPRGPYKSAAPEDKTCAACGTTFLVGGRGNPTRRQRFCSNECQRASRYRRGAVAKPLDSLDAAYLAGIVDGEGTIMLQPRRDTVSLSLTVSNTYMPLLDWIVERTAVGQIQRTRAATERHKATYFWRCNSDAAASVIEQIQARLIVKARQATLALETQTGLRDPARKWDRSWQHANLAAMKLMNKRGGS